MESNPTTVLLIEDSPADVRAIEKMLVEAAAFRPSTFKLVHASSLASGLARLVNTVFDVILLDLTLPDSQGINTISSVRSLAPKVPIITMTDVEDELLAIEAMQQGTQDYLVKGKVNGNSLARAIRYAIERQRMVAEVAQKATELQKRNTELDDFAHTVAHQVQGLLSQMVGYTGYIDINYGDELDDEVRRLLNQILQSGHKMNNVISELLLLASVRKGELISVPLNMTRIVAEAQKRLQFQIAEFQGRIFKPEGWPVALGYPSWIEEVWVNYISNGLKYGGPSPLITLGANSRQDGTIRFWVQDDGDGISDTDQKKLFTPHTRLHQIRARGEGLGLSIVRRIVEKCGGRVGVESDVGSGSRFWFTLPEADLLGESTLPVT
jgi:signal transduction histidine kinase